MDRIRESFDSLPVAICFFDKNGVVRLINHRMLMLTDRLRKNGIQTFDELEAALQQPPETVCCLNKELQLYRFWDESVFQFTEKTIRAYPIRRLQPVMLRSFCRVRTGFRRKTKDLRMQMTVCGSFLSRCRI